MYRLVLIVSTIAIAVLMSFNTSAKPSAQWTYEYNSNCGMRPDQLKYGSHKILMKGYQTQSSKKAAYTSIIYNKKDNIFLRMSHDGGDVRYNNCAAKFAHYLLPLGDHKVKTGSSIIETKFRIISQNAQNPQFSILLQKDYENGNVFFACVAFARNQIIFNGPNNKVVKKIDLGSKWHQFKLIVDWTKKTFSLYLKGNFKPIILSKLPQAKGKACLQFGDGSSTVVGCTDLKFLRLKY